MTEHRRALVGVGVALTIAFVVGAAAGLHLRQSGSAAAATSVTVPVATAAVVRTDLSNTTPVQGALGYASSYTVSTPRSGMFTALPTPGQVVSRGQSLFEVDGRTVPLFYGDRPEWRRLSAGVAAGPDVAQLESNLAALGYLDSSDTSGDGTFTWWTAYGLERWQADQGLAQTGVLQASDVVYASGPVRVATVTATLGGDSRPGEVVLTATSPAQEVRADLPVSQEVLVRAGDSVTITLPDAKTITTGKVLTIASVATLPPQAGQYSGAEPTVALTVALDHPEVAGGLDQAPVTINITTNHVEGVLAVPINALVALAEGGYAVQLVEHSRTRLVAVQTGLFAQTLVQVTSSELATGMRVEVPAS